MAADAQGLQYDALWKAAQRRFKTRLQAGKWGTASIFIGAT